MCLQMLVQKGLRGRVNCIVEKRRNEELVDHAPRELSLPFGLNITTAPRLQHLTGEQMVVICKDDNEDKEEEKVIDRKKCLYCLKQTNIIGGSRAAHVLAHPPTASCSTSTRTANHTAVPYPSAYASAGPTATTTHLYASTSSPRTATVLSAPTILPPPTAASTATTGTPGTI